MKFREPQKTREVMSVKTNNSNVTQVQVLKYIYSWTDFKPEFFELISILEFSPGTPVSSTNKTNRHNITEILL